MHAKPILLRGQPVAGGIVPLICTPLVGRTPAAVRAELVAILPKHPDVLEWRVDHFEAAGDATQVVETARSIKAQAGPVPLLFTRRWAQEGGQPVALTETAVVELYAAVCAAGCVDLVDYELAHPAGHVERVRTAARAADVALMLSFHDFQATPSGDVLRAKFAAAEAAGADIAKVAVMPQALEDVLTLLEATLAGNRTAGIPLVTMSMGPLGVISRMLGGMFGSALTFAVGDAASAPGQVPIETLRSALDAVRRMAAG